MVVLIVILKSPLIGLSPVSRVLCAKEIAVTEEIAKMMAAKSINLLFIVDSSIDI